MRINVFKKDGPSVGGSSFTGGTLTNPLILAGDPTHPLGAATKQYVDSSLAALGTGGPISGTIPVASLPAFTGDVSSSAGTNILTLSNTGVAAGTYAKVTVDAKGRVTTGGALAASDIPNLDWSKITTGKPTTLSGYGITNGVNKSGDSMTGPLTLSGNATNPLHAVPLQQLNEVASSRVNKSGDSMTGPLTLNGNATSPLHAISLQQLNEVVSSDNALEFIASGTIPNAGLTVGLNANGTVSVITGSGQPESWGSPTIFASGLVGETSTVYDSTNQKVVIAYTNGNYALAVVGTVSGNSISFGAPVIFSGASSYDYFSFVSMVYDSANQKVVIVGQSGNTEYGDSYNVIARVGTVSGNSISFGPVNGFGIFVNNISMVYDSANQKVVIGFSNNDPGSGHYQYANLVVGTVSGNSISFGQLINMPNLSTNYVKLAYDPTNNKVIVFYHVYGHMRYSVRVCTVSGNSISFGPEVVFYEGIIDFATTTYDPINQKVVALYNYDSNNPYYGNYNRAAAIVGTVSGNSISFGSPVTFNNARALHISAVHSSVNNKVVIAYARNTSDRYGTFIIGTVSGNSISFSTPVVFHSGYIDDISVVYNSINDKVVIAYSTNYNGYTIVYSPNTLSTNKNTFIGISQNSAASGTTVKVKARDQIDSNQSGLTPGQLYYVSDNGTLTTTSTGNPLVGRAVSATKLLITNWAQ